MDQNSVQSPVNQYDSNQVTPNGSKGFAWKLSFLPLLGICLGIGAVKVARTAGLIFEKDDLRFLWWAYENVLNPWKAFVDPPLFGFYYRPLVSLVWWLHYVLFDLNPFLHQIAVGAWWLSILVFVYYWCKRYGSETAGFLAVLVFLCGNTGHNLLLWKSWLTTTVSIVFQLAALTLLFKSLVSPSRLKYLFFFVMFIFACFSKESALLCLPFTSLALILCSESAPRKRKVFLITTVALIGITIFFLTPALRRIVFQSVNLQWNVSSFIVTSCFYAEVVWGNIYLQIIGFLLVTAFVLICGLRPVRQFILFAVIGLVFYLVALYNQVNQESAAAWGIIVFSYACLLSPHWRLLLPLFVWFTLAFWPLPIMNMRFISYAADASVALPLILGTVWYVTYSNSTVSSAAITRYAVLFRQKVLVLILIVLFPFAIVFSMKNLFQWAGFGEVAFHNPAKIVTTQSIHDILAVHSGRLVYIDVGDRLSLETLIAMYLQNRYGAGVRLHPPPSADSYRLEAYTLRNYHVRPEDDPLNIWMHESVEKPLQESFDDPYFIPRLWQIHILGTCDSTQGWFPTGQFARGTFPLGQGSGYVNYKLTKTQNMHALKFVSGVNAFLPQDSSKHVLTFWLQAQRWDRIESITAELHSHDAVYRWTNVSPNYVNSFYNWQRVVLQLSNAVRAKKEGPKSEKFEVHLIINLKDKTRTHVGTISIDEIRLAELKTDG